MEGSHSVLTRRCASSRTYEYLLPRSALHGMPVADFDALLAQFQGQTILLIDAGLTQLELTPPSNLPKHTLPPSSG